MKLTAQEIQAIRDMRAMTRETSLAWRNMGGMLSGRISKESGETVGEMSVSAQLAAGNSDHFLTWAYF